MKGIFKVYLILSVFFAAACQSSKNRTSGASPHKEKKETRPGEVIFKQQCQVCHGINEDKSGPALKVIFSENRKMQWVKKFIVNSQQLIQSGDKLANAVYKKYHESYMPEFKQLSEKQLDELLKHIKLEYEKKKQ